MQQMSEAPQKLLIDLTPCVPAKKREEEEEEEEKGEEEGEEEQE